ncbi:hypothetical protein P7C70_g969, partial [Phenoliferia sp. Uapishka_3]
MNNDFFAVQDHGNWPPTATSTSKIPTIARVSSADSAARPRSIGSAFRLPSLSSLQLPGLSRQHPSPTSPPGSPPSFTRATSASSVRRKSPAHHRTTVSGHRIPNSRAFSIKESYSPIAEAPPPDKDSKLQGTVRGGRTHCLAFLRKVKTLTNKGATEEARAEAASDFIETRSKFIEYKRSRDRTSSTSSASTSASTSTSTSIEDPVISQDLYANNAHDQPDLMLTVEPRSEVPYWSYPPPTPLQFPPAHLYPDPHLRIPFPTADHVDYQLFRSALPTEMQFPQYGELYPQSQARTAYPSPRPSTASISRASSNSDLRHSRPFHEDKQPDWRSEEFGLRPGQKWSDERTVTHSVPNLSADVAEWRKEEQQQFRSF